MRKSLAVVTAALALTFGTASVAAAAIGSDTHAATVATTTADDDPNDNDDKTGLWGLVGLLGLAGLAGLRRRPTTTTYDARRDPTNPTVR